MRSSTAPPISYMTEEEKIVNYLEEKYPGHTFTLIEEDEKDTEDILVKDESNVHFSVMRAPEKRNNPSYIHLELDPYGYTDNYANALAVAKEHREAMITHDHTVLSDLPKDLNTYDNHMNFECVGIDSVIFHVNGAFYQSRNFGYEGTILGFTKKPDQVINENVSRHIYTYSGEDIEFDVCAEKIRIYWNDEYREYNNYDTDFAHPFYHIRIKNGGYTIVMNESISMEIQDHWYDDMRRGVYGYLEGNVKYLDNIIQQYRYSVK